MSTTSIIKVGNPTRGERRSEPIFFSIDEETQGDLWLARTPAGTNLICQRLVNDRSKKRSNFVTVADIASELEFTLIGPLDPARNPVTGIRELDPMECDAFARLDTGYFDLELCHGTAEGTGSSKWGLRHLRGTSEGIDTDLIPHGNNAVGGFYGPFFTPENGLINPPEHCVAGVETLERGPVLHRYRLRGTIPEGLLPELHGKSFEIDWQFTYGTPWFCGKYRVDNFDTVINGKRITNKITVGDEFESGPGDVPFTYFESYDGVHYRTGDPYAGELSAAVSRVLGTHPSSTNKKFETFRSQLTRELASAHWDLY